MRVAGTLGDWDRVIAAYRSCERALAELGTEPSAATAALLRDAAAERISPFLTAHDSR